MPNITPADAATIIYNNFIMGTYPGSLEILIAGDNFHAIFTNDSFVFEILVPDDGSDAIIVVEEIPPEPDPTEGLITYPGGGGGGEGGFFGGGSFGGGFDFGGYGWSWGGGGGGGRVTVHEAEVIQLV